MIFDEIILPTNRAERRSNSIASEGAFDLRKGDRYLREAEILKTRVIENKGLMIPTRIRVFGMEYQLCQPLNLRNYSISDAKEAGVKNDGRK